MLHLNKYEWKELIPFKITRRVGLIKITKVGERAWEELAEFPFLDGPVPVEYFDAETEIKRLEVDEIKPWFDANWPSFSLKLAYFIFFSTTQLGEAEKMALARDVQFDLSERIPLPEEQPTPSGLADCLLFDQLTITVRVSEFEQTRARLVHTFDSNKSLGALFDAFIPNSDVPYAVWNDFFKYSKFTDDMQPEISDRIVCADAVISSHPVSIQTENLAVFSAFNLTNPISSVQSFDTEFYLLNTSFEKTLFSHFLLVERPISKYLFIDDRKLIRKRSSLFIYFAPTGNSAEQCYTAIIQTKSTDQDVKLNRMSGVAEAVRVRVRKIKNDNALNFFANFLRLAFSRYKQLEDLLFRLYREKYEFNLVKAVPRAEKKVLLKHQSDLFLSGYSKKCQHAPEFQTADTIALDWIEYEKMRFVCTGPTFQFPGLIENTLENKTKYPCLPCCFISDQKEKASSTFNYFLKTGNCSKPVVGHSDMITTQKHLGENEAGTLVNSLKLFFGEDFYRFGVRDKSFKNCCRVVFGDKIDEAFAGLPQKSPEFLYPLIAHLIDLNIWLWDENGLVRPTTCPVVNHKYNSQVGFFHIFKNGDDFELIRTKSTIVFETGAEKFKELARASWRFFINNKAVDPVDDSPPKTDIVQQQLDSFSAQRSIVRADGSETFSSPLFPVFADEKIVAGASDLAHYRRTKRIALELLWTAYKLTRDNGGIFPQTVIESDGYVPSCDIPNETLITADRRLRLPEKMDIEQHVLNTLPRIIPAAIPNYFLSSIDFTFIPNVHITKSYPLQYDIPTVVVPPLDATANAFYIELGNVLYYAMLDEILPGAVLWIIGGDNLITQRPGDEERVYLLDEATNRYFCLVEKESPL